MQGKLLLALSLLVFNALADPIPTPEIVRRYFLPNVKGGEWKRNKRVAVVQQVELKNTPYDSDIPEDDIISWLKLDLQSFPLGNKSNTARDNIANFVSTTHFTLGLVDKIQKVFGPSTQSVFTRMLNFIIGESLYAFILQSPCAYEKIVSLSNYSKLNMV